MRSSRWFVSRLNNKAREDKHKTTTILQFAEQVGCFLSHINGILPVLNSKIVDKYNISLN
ncbi:hypothetical protein CWM52_21395 [Raoultella sp. T31]|nr:hypothetical protein CWM52_21395 [Raoultella sp. T31]